MKSLIRQVVSVVALTLFLVGCGSKATQEGAVQFTAAATASDVDRVVLTVASGSFVVQQTLTRSGDNWSALLAGIPPGLATFTASAFDFNNVLLFTGTTTATIVAGQTANVNMTLQDQVPPNPFFNSAPYFTSLSLSSGSVQATTPLFINVAAIDPDGDPLTFAFADGGAAGTFGPVTPGLPGEASVTYTPAASDAGHTVTIVASVNDGNGATSTVTFTIDVTTAPAFGSANVNVAVNGAPAVTGIVATLPAIVNVNDAFSLTAIATDPEGQALSYAWSIATPANCTGTFSAAAATSIFTLTSFAPAALDCTLRVTVTDSAGGSNTGDLVIQVGANITPIFQPQIIRTSQTPGPAVPVAAGDTVTFEIVWFEPDATDVVVVDWTAAPARFSPSIIPVSTSLPAPGTGYVTEVAEFTMPAGCTPGSTVTVSASVNDWHTTPVPVNFPVLCQ